MNNIEKRLQAILRRAEVSEQRKNERILKKRLKKTENGTKEIYYTILRKIIKNKEEDVRIGFTEFVDFDTKLSYVNCVKINNEMVCLGKTWCDLKRLEELLKVFDFSMTRSDYYFSKNQDQIILSKGPIRMSYHNLFATRSQVCHKLLTLPPQNQPATLSLNNDGPRLTKK